MDRRRPPRSAQEQTPEPSEPSASPDRPRHQIGRPTAWTIQRHRGDARQHAIDKTAARTCSTHTAGAHSSPPPPSSRWGPRRRSDASRRHTTATHRRAAARKQQVHLERGSLERQQESASAGTTGRFPAWKRWSARRKSSAAPAVVTQSDVESRGRLHRGRARVKARSRLFSSATRHCARSLAEGPSTCTIEQCRYGKRRR